MAKVRDNHLGALQGKMGPSVFKIRKGKTFAASAPGKRKKAKTELESATMSRMGLLSRFASAVCKINKLKEIWNNYYNSQLDTTRHFDDEPFQRIIAVNYSKAANNFLASEAFLTPEYEKSIVVKKYLIESENFILEFDTDDTRLMESDLQCDFFLMIHLSHPLEKKSDKIRDNHKFIILKKSQNSFTFMEKGNTISFPFNAQYRKALEDFSKAMVFFSAFLYKDSTPVTCANALGFILKGMELHETDVKEYERIKGIKTKKQIKKEKALENPDFDSVIV